MPTVAPLKAQSISQLLDGSPEPEYIALVGKDSVGKSSAIVSYAKLVEDLQPDATFFVIDSEDKFRSALLPWGGEAPKNILYFRVGDMNQCIAASQEVIKRHKPWDWVAVESAARLWERAQNLAYLAIAGVTKVEYLEMEQGQTTPTGIQRKGAPIPTPDDFWPIAKGAFDRAFLDNLTKGRQLNVIISSTVTKPRDPQQQYKFKESADRKAIRAELGIGLGIDGPPRLPYDFKTLCLLELNGGNVTARVLRDNLSTADNTRLEFEVPTKKDFATMFYSQCR